MILSPPASKRAVKQNEIKRRNESTALKIAFENLILAEANWVVCWQDFRESLRLPFTLLALLLYIQPTAWRGFPLHFPPFATWRCQLPFWGKTPHVKPPLAQNKKAEPQPNSLSPLTSQNIPPGRCEVRQVKQSNNRAEEQIHKSHPGDETEAEIRKWQCEAGGVIFTAVTSGEAVFLLAFRRQRERRFCCRRWPERQQGGGGRGQQGAYLEHKG